MTKTNSVKTAVHFAALSGNVCFLLQAIKMLKTTDDCNLTESDLNLPALRSPCLEALILIKKYENGPSDLKTLERCCLINDETGHCYTWEEIEKPFVLIKRHQFKKES